MYSRYVTWTNASDIKGELNPNNKLGLNDSFSTQINKYKQRPA